MFVGVLLPLLFIVHSSLHIKVLICILSTEGTAPEKKKKNIKEYDLCNFSDTDEQTRKSNKINCESQWLSFADDACFIPVRITTDANTDAHTYLQLTERLFFLKSQS